MKWKKSDVKFEDRFDKYLDPSFFQHRVSENIFFSFLNGPSVQPSTLPVCWYSFSVQVDSCTMGNIILYSSWLTFGWLLLPGLNFTFCALIQELMFLFLIMCLNNCFQIHWFSIFNSFMMVIFLVGLVSMILMRTLRKDYARYSKEEEMDDMVSLHSCYCF